ncbi:MAG: hypothetical protein ACYTAN_15265 [Planctomycetota bacterium]
MKSASLAAVVLIFCAFTLAEAATVTVTEIAASGTGGEVTIDRKIEDLKPDLVKRFAFSKYEFLSRKSTSLAQGALGTWRLSDGNSLDIKLSKVEGTGAAAKFTLELEIYKSSSGERKSVMKTTYKVTAGRTVMLVLGELSSGKTLILVIKVE